MKNGPRGYEKKKINYEFTFILASGLYGGTSTVSNSYLSYSLKKNLLDSHGYPSHSVKEKELL